MFEMNFKYVFTIRVSIIELSLTIRNILFLGTNVLALEWMWVMPKSKFKLDLYLAWNKWLCRLTKFDHLTWESLTLGLNLLF